MRDDLTRREVMDAVMHLQEAYGWSVREIAKRTGRNASDLSILTRIARHPEASQLVAEERITPTAIGHLLRLPKASQQAALGLVRSGRIRTVEQALRYVTQSKGPATLAALPEERVISHTTGHATAPASPLIAPPPPDVLAAEDVVYVKAHTRARTGAMREGLSEDPLGTALRSIVALVQDQTLTAAFGSTQTLAEAAWADVWRAQDEAVHRLRALVSAPPDGPRARRRPGAPHEGV